MNQQMEAARKAMTDWLDKPPVKLECAGEFDLHDLHYYIFKFKEKRFGPWLLGVAGGYEGDDLEDCGHVFSNMRPYDAKTAKEECIQMVERLRACWMEQAKIQRAFEQNLAFLSSEKLDPETIERQFRKDGSHFWMELARIPFPTGNLMAGDPLAYLPSRFSPVLDVKIEPGTYPVQISIYRDERVGIRICTLRVKTKESKVFSYVPVGSFPVDAGMATLCDKATAEAYGAFLSAWHKANPDKNHYDDFFAHLFQESWETYPSLQREGGDFIVWLVPGTDHKLVLCASGFGDGMYTAFAGYDENQEVCEITIPLVNPELFETERDNADFIPDAGGVVVPRSILEGTSKLKWMERSIPCNGADSGWMAIGDKDTQAYLDDSSNLAIVDFNTLANLEPAVYAIYHEPTGSSFELVDGKFVKENR